MPEGELVLRAGHVHVMMDGMMRTRVTGCAAAAMLALLSACQVQQQQQQQPGIEPTTVETNESTPDGEKPQTTGVPETSTPAAEGEDSHKHVCSGLLSCKLGLCPNGKKHNKQTAAEDQPEKAPEGDAETKPEPQVAEVPAADNEEPEVIEPITPSAEQMKAAQELMAAEAKRRKKSSRPTAAPTETLPVESPAPEPTVVNNTSGIPGRGGLRMGHFAPPEEAASRSENSKPRPNAAERHGLRSLSLPKTLPMNIDGQTNAH